MAQFDRLGKAKTGFFKEFSNFLNLQPEKNHWNFKIFFFETSSQKGMFWKNKKKIDFSSLIFDSQNIVAASLTW